MYLLETFARRLPAWNTLSEFYIDGHAAISLAVVKLDVNHVEQDRNTSNAAAGHTTAASVPTLCKDL